MRRVRGDPAPGRWIAPSVPNRSRPRCCGPRPDNAFLTSPGVATTGIAPSAARIARKQNSGRRRNSAGGTRGHKARSGLRRCAVGSPTGGNGGGKPRHGGSTWRRCGTATAACHFPSWWRKGRIKGGFQTGATAERLRHGQHCRLGPDQSMARAGRSGH